MPTLIIHGHYYQPPRENPRSLLIENEPGCAPYPNWNEKIHEECYKPNADLKIFEKINFNIGPTLFAWLEKNKPDTYQKIIDADRLSFLKNNGHGNAIAQSYNHSILPLCSPKDRKTQIKWGKEDFIHRFERIPEAMWLPEAAINQATINDLIDEGFKYVVLSPQQIQTSAKPNASQPYYVRHGQNSEKSLAVFVYDQTISHQVAFGGALKSPQHLSKLIKGTRLVHLATDGETFGHHHKQGAATLAESLQGYLTLDGHELTNYGSYLERVEPVQEIKIKENSAWSCEHGLERWLKNCGCKQGGDPKWNQNWREPLRDALDFLQGEIDKLFVYTLQEHVDDPWTLRDQYISVILGQKSFKNWFRQQAQKELKPEEVEKMRVVFEAERLAMAMFTSCGWFFSDISGIETTQNLRCAHRALELLELIHEKSPREIFLTKFSKARSNIPPHFTGDVIFSKLT